MNDSPELQLATEIARFSRDPHSYALFNFPWGAASLAGSKGPRPWQQKILLQIRDHLNGPKRYTPLKLAVASGHGIGKSCLIAMLVSWALDTCSGARVLVTANTEPQLRTKTWPEITKWKGIGLTKNWFTIGATSIKSAIPEYSSTWRADMVAWSENNTEAFSGLHNVGKRILVVFDEASAIAKPIWEVTEGTLTDEGTEIIWLAFGNPTQNTGSFRECFGSQSHRWQTFQIDSRTVEGTNKDQIAKWIEDYGEDSDFVRVRVRGEFPRVASTQFIPQDVVARARKTNHLEVDGLPRIMAVDVARFGDDDSVIAERVGRKMTILFKQNGLSTSELAERVARLIDERHPDATVIDGDGIGAGVVDHLQFRGYTARVFEFHGGEKAIDTAAYANRRAEVWGKLRESLMAGCDIPDDPALEQDLVQVQYGMNVRGQIQLERKADMKARGLRSPDMGDALAMTFAVEVRKVKRRAGYMPVPLSGGASGWMAV